ncbi:hypothetical protein M3J09_002106 [Ascochyta lentis]
MGLTIVSFVFVCVTRKDDGVTPFVPGRILQSTTQGLQAMLCSVNQPHWYPAAEQCMLSSFEGLDIDDAEKELRLPLRWRNNIGK